MRTRHWKQLVRATGGEIHVDSEVLKNMTFGELLSLGLQSILLWIFKQMKPYLYQCRASDRRKNDSG